MCVWGFTPTLADWSVKTHSEGGGGLTAMVGCEGNTPSGNLNHMYGLVGIR